VTEMNWDKIKETKWSDATPPKDWPQKVTPISMNGLALLGISQTDGRLFWDGKEIVVKSKLLKLRGFELLLLALAAVGTMMQGIATFVPWLKAVTDWW
jgi:hypothetical protein